MMKIVAFTFALFLFVQTTSAQTDTTTSRHILYAEGGGIGGYVSVNYENVFFSKGFFKLSARVGVGSYRMLDFQNQFNPDVIIPVALYGMVGKTHFAEIGFGQAIASTVHVNIENLQPDRRVNLHANFSVAYRFQRAKGGLFFRLSYSPLVEYYQTFRHWGGISVGYIFKAKKK
jgi:hypothetical protein